MERLSRDEMQREASLRLQFLKLHPHILSHFRDGVLAKTDNNTTVERLTDEEKKLVRAFESQTGNLVYYVIFNDIPECGKLYRSYLFPVVKEIGKMNGSI